MKPRVYIDTSVIGGYYDEEFKDATRAFFERFKRGEIIFIVSDLLELELTGAPPRVRELLTKFPSGKFESASISEEIIKLADAYVLRTKWWAKQAWKIAGILLWPLCIVLMCWQAGILSIL